MLFPTAPFDHSLRCSTKAQALHNINLSLEALQEVLSFHSRRPLDHKVKQRRDHLLSKWYDKDNYDIHMIDVTADELLRGNASIWDDVLYKLYFVLCHDDVRRGKLDAAAAGGGDDDDGDDEEEKRSVSPSPSPPPVPVGAEKKQRPTSTNLSLKDTMKSKLKCLYKNGKLHTKMKPFKGKTQKDPNGAAPTKSTSNMDTDERLCEGPDDQNKDTLLTSIRDEKGL